MSVFHHGKQIVSDLSDLFAAVEISSVFKVEIERTVIEIDGTESCAAVIGYHDLRMYEARIEYEDLHAAYHQL